ncbi:MAG: hypothetical protein ACJAWW_002796 [Sulfurimonas sp.]|jgi:hypothetical protein
MSKDVFDDDLNDHLNQEENQCENCKTPTYNTYCSKGCKIEHNN